MRFTRMVSALALALALLLPAAADAQLIEFDSPLAVASEDFAPGVTLVAPFGASWVNVYGHASHGYGRPATDPAGAYLTAQGPVSDATITVGTNNPVLLEPGATNMEMGAEFMTPRLWRFQPYARVAFRHLDGTLNLGAWKQVAFAPGLRFYLRDNWGLGFRAHSVPLYDLTSVADLRRTNPSDWRMVISLFGNLRE